MTEEQFKKACVIQNKLQGLKKVKHDVLNAQNARLSYTYKDALSNNAMHSKFTLAPIEKILEKYDKMIREEIDKEIRKLQEEIKTL